MQRKEPIKILWILIYLAVFIWSGIGPKDRLTWILEVSPAVIGFVILAVTYSRFRLTSMLYAFILLHAIVLMVGGHYTYAEVPGFSGWFGFERNNFDKIGHFFQGFVPALIAREILLRKAVVSTQAWLKLFVLSICLAFSAFYELIEWWVALLSDEAAESFLGTQGYVWDTQSDMALALLGAIFTLLVLAPWQDKQLKSLV